jgi:hypothetical protein
MTDTIRPRRTPSGTRLRVVEEGCKAAARGALAQARNCPVCGCRYQPRVSQVKHGQGLFCSRPCKGRATGGIHGRRAEGLQVPSDPVRMHGALVCFVPLVPSGVAVIDAEDRDLVAKYSWNLSGAGYARAAGLGDDTGKTVFLHRLVSGAAPVAVVDHLNGDPLDNRRCNLRVATQAANRLNCWTPKSSCSHSVPGVTRVKARRKYSANITLDGRRRFLGHFSTHDEAAAASAHARAEALGFCPLALGDLLRRFPR